MKNRFLITILILCIAVCRAFAFDAITDRLLFMHIGDNSGLSENHVKAITKDRHGFVWIGTRNGLNRYDGCNIKTYDVDDLDKHFGNHNVSALYEANDGKLWVGTDKGVFIMDPDTERFTFFDLKTSRGHYPSNWVNQIVGDKAGNVWIVLPNEGAYRYDTRKKRLALYRTSKSFGQFDGNIQSVCVRRDGSVWFGTNGNGLYRYDKRIDNLRLMTRGDAQKALAGKNIYALTDYGSWLVVGEHEARLVKYNPQTGELRDVDSPGVHYKIIRAVATDGQRLYVGTQEGLYVIDEKAHKERVIRESTLSSFGLSCKMIYTVYIDSGGGLWLGTNTNGVDYLPPEGINYNVFLPSLMPGSISGKMVNEMAVTPDGDVWLSSDEGFVNIFDPRTKTFRDVPMATSKSGSNRLALYYDNGKIWSGTFKNGIDIIDSRTLAVSHYAPRDLGLVGDGSVYAVMRDRDGKMWLGTGRDVYVQADGMKFRRVNGLGGIYVQDFIQDRKGDIWVCTIGMGLYRFNVRTDKITHYQHDASDSTTVSSNDITSVSADHKGNLWFGTDRGGLCCYDFAKNVFASYGKADGLPDDVTYKVLEDGRHNLWFGTNHGLVRFNPATREATVYSDNMQYLGSQYSIRSAVKLADGTMLFGTQSGLRMINSNSIYSDMSSRRVMVTNLKVDNKDVRPEKGGIIEANIFTSRKIRLPYNFSSLHLDIGTLEYNSIESVDYEYRLEGVDKDWNIATTKDGINYTRLQPGKYGLTVRERGNKANTTTLEITVRHPWWDTILARVVYVMLIIAFVALLFRNQQLRQTRRMQRRARIIQASQEKELLQSKISFFTDVTHEIRTPLTLISGSLETINDSRIEDKAIRKNLRSVKMNCQRLLNLINQLMEFRKTDPKTLKLNFVRLDVCRLVNNIITRFEPAAANQGRTIGFDADEEAIMVPVNSEAVTKIVSNLLNNAMKYSESFMQVSIRHNASEVRISVVNDGARIPENMSERIFEPFVRLDRDDSKTGTGIGLPLAKSLAEMHHGSLRINKESEYNEFVLTLPMRQDNVIEMQCEELPDTHYNDIVEEYAENAGTTKGDTILVVEDNAEIVDLLRDNFGSDYMVLSAANGQEALDLIDKNKVSLVVTDVMMPVMDGLELTCRIKTDVNLSHMPVIMLTARQTLDNRIEGLKAGADAYIEKPFSMAHLRQQIQTLLENRRREQESFLHKPYLTVEGSGTNKVEEDFLNKMNMVITENMHDPDFNVERLAKEMCMSRSSLHRKIKEVSNLTPIDFIRLIKLKKAAELIRQKGYRANEVCEEIGISSPSYFIKLFQKQFGMTPKEFAMENKG